VVDRSFEARMKNSVYTAAVKNANAAILKFADMA
jgi:hypothetical protein